MAQTYKYDGSSLANVRRDSVSFTEMADMGQAGTGKLTLNDDAGTVELFGHKSFRSEQSSCAVVTTFRGFLGERDHYRGQQFVTSTRQIDLAGPDLNAKFGFKVIRGRAWRKRPKESIGDRLTALLASGYLPLNDNGFVAYPSTELEKADLRGQHPGDVLADWATRVGFNFFAYWDEAAGEASLWFQDSNTSEDWSSTLRISNDPDDIDSSTTFAPYHETHLARTPDQTVSGVWLPFRKGNVYRTRAATEDTYEPRDGTAPNANVKKRSRAQNIADRFLRHHSTEEDTITTTVRLPAAKANLIRAGQRIECKFSHYETEGYGDFTWFRVMERTTTQPKNDDLTYDLALRLSPQEAQGEAEAEGCDDDLNFLYGAVSADHDRHEWDNVVGFPGGDGAFFEFDMWLGGVSLLNDGDNATATTMRPGVVINSSNQFKTVMYTDLGEDREASAYLLDGGNYLDDIVHMTFESSTDGSTWTPFTGTESFVTMDGIEYWKLTFTAPITARYFSIVLEHIGVNFDGFHLTTWRICP